MLPLQRLHCKYLVSVVVLALAAAATLSKMYISVCCDRPSSFSALIWRYPRSISKMRSTTALQVSEPCSICKLQPLVGVVVVQSAGHVYQPSVIHSADVGHQELGCMAKHHLKTRNPLQLVSKLCVHMLEDCYRASADGNAWHVHHSAPAAKTMCRSVSLGPPSTNYMRVCILTGQGSE